MNNSYSGFDDYVADYPEGERYRNWLTDRTIGVPVEGPTKIKNREGVYFEKREAPLRIIRGEGVHAGLPGGYLWASVSVRYLGSGYKDGWRFFVTVHDSDDGAIDKAFERWEDALAALQDLCDLAPLDMRDLADFGYGWH